MKPILRRPLGWIVAFTATAGWAVAHPGHEGDHGLIWESRNMASHPLETAGYVVLLLVTVWAFARVSSRGTDAVRQSLRESQRNRGK